MTKPNDEQQLLPCECGHKVYFTNPPDDGLVGVECPNCFIKQGWSETKEQAIARWNMHKPSPRAGLSVVEALEALLVAVCYKTPTVDYGTKEEPNPCYEARVPVQFVHDAHKALAAQPSDRTVGELRKALEEISKLGHEGMKPDYKVWLTFHNKIAEIADQALAKFKRYGK